MIIASVPSDYQSLEILRVAYIKLGRGEESLATWRKIVRAHLALDQLSDAQIVAEEILAQHSGDTETLSLHDWVNCKLALS